MKIGIVITLNPSSGGLHQYGLSVLDSLARLANAQFSKNFTLFYYRHEQKHLANISSAAVFPAIILPETLKARAYNMLRGHPLGKLAIGLLERLRNSKAQQTAWETADVDTMNCKPTSSEIFTKNFAKNRIDWVFYTAPNTLSFESNVPFVMPIHDLQHRIQPHFPEVSASGQWNYREYLFRNATRFATLILADSETGKEDILQYYGEYGITPDRIKVVPFVAPPYLFPGVQGGSADVSRKYALPENYFFYPAQFWPHKNHIRLVEAVSILKQQGVTTHIILCGHHTGELRDRTFREVMELAAERGISSQVHYLGRVPDSDISAIYAGATALVMPTYFGPTNIPVVEAWALGCPVLTSDLRGIREQVGDAGLLADPDSAEDIAWKMRTLMDDENLRRNLSEKGRLMIRQYSFDGFHAKLSEVVREATERVSQGDIPVQP